MQIINAANYDEMSALAADLVSGQIKKKKNAVLGLATGSTFVGLYRRLILLHKKNKVDFSNVITFNLDEYYPMKRSDNQSFYHFMTQNLLNAVNINQKNIHIPNGESLTPDAECAAYDQKIAAAGGIDIMLLGVGVNGHIGFNEPGDYLVAGTHRVTLTDSTIQANSRFFKSQQDVPKEALTMGIHSILSAGQILLLINGKNKQQAYRALLSGRITPQCPVTMLHAAKNVTVITADME